MKKFTRLALLLTCALLCAFVFAACEPKPAEPPTTAQVALTDTAVAITDTTITVTPTLATCEYALYNGDTVIADFALPIQGKLSYDNLTAATEYKLLARTPATDKLAASASIEVKKLTTLSVGVAPTQEQIALAEGDVVMTDTTIEVTAPVATLEYALYNGETLVADFALPTEGKLNYTSLTAATQYTLKARTPATATATASAAIGINLTTLGVGITPTQEQIVLEESDVAVTDTTIEVTVPVATLEYALYNGETLVSDFALPTEGKLNYTTLTAATQYTLKARTPATATTVASAAVEVGNITTLGAGVAPTQEQIVLEESDVAVTDTTIEVTVPVANLEYALYNGETLVSDFALPTEGKLNYTTLTAATQYTLKARTPATATAAASPAIDVKVIITVGVQTAPDAEQYALADTNVTISSTKIDIKNADASFEYALMKDGKPVVSFMTPSAGKISFSGLTANTPYDVVIRIAAKEGFYASAAVTVGSFTTVAIPNVNQIAISDDNVDVTLTSITITVTDANLEYALFENTRLVSDYTLPLEGVLRYSELTDTTYYTLKARVPAKDNALAGDVVEVREVTTLRYQSAPIAVRYAIPSIKMLISMTSIAVDNASAVIEYALYKGDECVSDFAMASSTLVYDNLISGAEYTIKIRYPSTRFCIVSDSIDLYSFTTVAVPDVAQIAISDSAMVLTDSSVIITVTDDSCEYALYHGDTLLENYQLPKDGRLIYEGLTPANEYTLMVRTPANLPYIKSDAVALRTIKILNEQMAPDANELTLTSGNIVATDSTLEITVPVAALEYNLYLGEASVGDYAPSVENKVSYSNLVAGTQYILMARVPATTTAYASNAVEIARITTAGNQLEPSALEAVLSDNNATVSSTKVKFIGLLSTATYALYQGDNLVSDYAFPEENSLTYENLTAGLEYDLRVRFAPSINAPASAALNVYTFMTVGLPDAAAIAIGDQALVYSGNSLSITIADATLEYCLFIGEVQYNNYIKTETGKLSYKDLADNTEFKLCARIPASGSYAASDAVVVKTFTTPTLDRVEAPNAADFDIDEEKVIRSHNYLTLTLPVRRYEYALYEGVKPISNFRLLSVAGTADRTYIGLTEGTTYTLYVRKPAKDGLQASVPVAIAQFTTRVIPSAPTPEQLALEAGDFRTGMIAAELKAPDITLEYGVFFQGRMADGWRKADDNGYITFNILSPSTEYQIYARVPITEVGTSVSKAALVSVFTTLAADDAACLAETAAFKQFCDDQFVIEMSSSSSINIHYTLKNPADYNIPYGWVYDENGDQVLDEDGNPVLIADMYSIDLTTLEDTSNDSTLEFISELETEFDDVLMDEEYRLLYRILVKYLKNNLTDESINLNYFGGYFDSISGIQSNMPINFAEYTFYNEMDVQVYLALLKQLPDFFAQCLEFEALRVEKGYGMSDSVLDSAIQQCNDFLECGVEAVIDAETGKQTTPANYLILTFEHRIDALDLSPEKKAQYKQQNIECFTDYLAPAFELLATELAKFKGECVNELGLSHFENGQYYYEYLAKSYTGSDLTVDEMYKMFDSLISSSISTIFACQDNEEFYSAYRSNSGMPYGFMGMGSTLVDEMIAYLQDKMYDYVPEIPLGTYVVKEVEKALEDSLSPAFYMIPPIDDYLNNVIYINYGKVDRKTLFSTLAHEGFPGHLYQKVYFFSNNPHPMRDVFSFSGYAEGWASHVESLSYEMYDFGMSESGEKAAADYGRANDMWSLALSCAVDIGVNYYGWDAETLMGRMQGWYASVESVDDVKGIMEVVISSPGTYLKYGVGVLEINQMWEEAQKALGEDFDLKTFNTIYLDVGPAHFEFIREQVQKYINATAGEQVQLP